MVVTAQEYLKSKSLKGSNDSFTDKQIEEFLIEFAMLHREEALKQASVKAKRSFVPDINTKGGGYYVINKDSILNAYSKKNIR